MRLIPTRAHGMMDYLVGSLLIAAPWLADLTPGGAETWVPVMLGASVILYSLFTDYELGVVRRLPMPTHLTLDLAGGVWLASSPWLLGFADQVWTPHLIVGLVEIGTSLMTSHHPDRRGARKRTVGRQAWGAAAVGKRWRLRRSGR